MLATVLQLAADDPELEGRGPEWGKAAPVALLIILLMGIGLFLLIRSMNTQLRKVPSAFMRGDQPAAEPSDDTSPATVPTPTVPTESTVSTVSGDADPPDATGSATRS